MRHQLIMPFLFRCLGTLAVEIPTPDYCSNPRIDPATPGLSRASTARPQIQLPLYPNMAVPCECWCPWACGTGRRWRHGRCGGVGPLGSGLHRALCTGSTSVWARMLLSGRSGDCKWILGQLVRLPVLQFNKWRFNQAYNILDWYFHTLGVKVDVEWRKGWIR